MKILLVGNGSVAEAVEEVCVEQKVKCVRILDPDCQESFNVQDSVAVHLGSGRQLGDLIRLAEKSGVPIIQGSSYPEAIELMNGEHSARMVHAPNLSIPINVFMEHFRRQTKDLLKVMDLSILESHQKGKADLSKTAREMADMAFLNHEDIDFERDPKIQKEALGVPEEFLDGHAYHFFNFEGMGVKIQTSIMVNGRSTYGLGAILLAKGLIKFGPLLDFSNGVIKFVDIPQSVYLPSKEDDVE